MGFTFSYKFKMNNWQQFVHLLSFLYKCSVAFDNHIVDKLIPIFNSNIPGRVSVYLFSDFFLICNPFFSYLIIFPIFLSVPN